MAETGKQGFASMDEKKQREIASEGGKASSGNFANDPKRASQAAKDSGGNFANDPKRASEAGHDGGQASGGNFANDPKRAADAGQKGGHASSGGTHEQHVKDGQQSHKNT